MNFLAGFFGWIMNMMCLCLRAVGIFSVPAGIVVFAVLMSLAILPVTLGQIKFSLAMRNMTPKMQEIKDRYAKMEMTDEAIQRQTEEINAVYEENGVTPSGRVFGFVLQFVLLMAMYQVAGNVPRYVPMFQGADIRAFLFFGTLISDIPAVLLASGANFTAIVVLAWIFLTMLPTSAILKKNRAGTLSGLAMAAFFTVVASKLPMGLCLYWIARSLTGTVIRMAAVYAFRKKEKIRALGTE